VTTVDRLGQPVTVTTLERTVADLFDRPDLAGGAEELFKSLALIGRLDADRVAQHLAATGNATAAGAAGWWLETQREPLRVLDTTLEAIRELAPHQNRYALGATVGAGQAAPGWGVILPRAIVEQRLEGH
jgi:predicted transcriptional regulator of viral defense system